MAITSGVRPHTATVNGIPVTHGTVHLSAKRKNSTCSCTVPMSFQGALSTFATGGGNLTVTVNGASLFQGVLDSADFDMINRTITVSGRDMAASLHEKTTAEKWQNKTPSDIIQDLAQKAGLSAQVTVSSGGNVKAGRKVLQDFAKLSDGVPYSSVIQKMSEFLGANWYVQNGQLIVSDQPTGNYSLNYQPPSPFIVSDCLSLSISVNYKAASQNQVTVNSWHPRDRKTYTGTGNAGGGIGGGNSMNFTFHLPELTQDQAQQWAKSKAQEIARHAFTLTAEVVGDPTIMAGMGVQLSGTGFFDNTYFADEVTHTFGIGGYTTSITGRTSGSEGGE